jgi:DNA-binding PadR family transcriptional regulator
MHGHHGHHTHDTPEDGGHGHHGGPPWAARGDLTRGAVRGRGRRRGRGRPDGFGPGFGRGPKVRRGDVRAAILALLAEEPMHGYQIITELVERSGGVWRPSPGSVYPTLSALEDQGLVVADKAEGKRVFALTPDGRAEAEAAADGPAPWEEAAAGDRTLSDLRGLMVQVAKATQQVAQAGTPGQIAAAAEILTDARRRIYLVLADGGPSDDEPTVTNGD